MKSRLPLHSRYYFLVLIILFLGILASCSTAPAAHTNSVISQIRVVMDNNYPPYAFTDEQGKMQGILVDQWKLWEERTGVKVEIVGLPWDQALGGMRNGEYDVIDTIFYTDERARIFDFTKPYANIDVRIFFPKNVSGIANVESLQGFRVAVKTGDANAEYLVEHGITDLIYYDSYGEIIKAAADKKETIFVIDQPPALYFLYKYNIQDQFAYSEPLYGGQFHRAVKKGNTALFEVVNSGFANISTAEYQQINNRWFGASQSTNVAALMPYIGIGAAAAALLVAILLLFNRELQARVKARTQELEETLANLKDSETRFREAETKYRTLVENAPEVIYLDHADETGSNIYISAQVENLLGYAPVEFSQNSRLWHKIVHPEDYQRAFGSISKTLAHGSAVEEYRMIKRDGSMIWVRDTALQIRDENDKVILIQGFLQDITERKQMEESLKGSEERYRTLFEDSPVALLEEDFSEVKKYIDQLREKGIEDLRTYFEKNPGEAQQCAGMVRVIDVNKATMNWYQVKNKTELQVKLNRLMNADGYKSFIEELLALMEGGNHYEIAVSRLDHKGNPLHIVISGTVVPNYEETWGRVLVSILDVTERKQAEDRILRLNRLYATTSQIDQTIVRERDRETLFKEICRVAIEHGQFRMAWIGLVNEMDQRVVPAVFAGEEQGYLKTININYRDEILGQGPTGTAVRENRCVISQDIATDPGTLPWREQALQRGYRSSAAVPIHEHGRVIGALSVYSAEPHDFDEENKKLLNEIGLDISFALDSINAEAERKQAEDALFHESALNAKMANDLQLAYDTTLEGWSRALDLRDKETEGHTRRVTELTLQLAREFNFNEEELTQIKRGALLHDIGKMGIPDSILLKPASLTDEEWVIMRRHTAYAYELLLPVQYLQPALDIPHYHHERWDGSGYPHGLKGEQIPLTARIFAVVDAWDALTSDRPYRAAWEPEKVKEHLRNKAGTEFDRRVVDIFLKMMENKET